MVNLPFGKKKEELSDIPELPPLDLDQVPSGPPVTGAPQRLEAAEQAQLTPGAPPTALPTPPPAPMPPSSPIPYAEPTAPSPPLGSGKDHIALMTEDIEKIAEDIIEEKWTKLVGEVNEIKNWKDNVAKHIEETKGALDKLDTKINDVQKAILGKVGEYNQSIKDVNVELKAMSKVFEKILPTFTDNVKKLSALRARPKVTKVTTITKTVTKKKKRGRPKKK